MIGAGPRPTIVVVLFDQKQKQAGAKPKLAFDGPGIVRYLTRLDVLPAPWGDPRGLVDYVVRDGDVAAILSHGFHTDSLAGMAGQLVVDARRARANIYPIWVHGCASFKISPKEYEGSAEDFLPPVEDLMKLLGVDQNRYLLVVHRDSDHFHCHFLYSRIGPTGGLFERERKMPRFMAEEACAVLADRYGFDLEAGHLSRVSASGVLDLASGKLTRDPHFEPILEGCKRRNAARKKTRANPLLKLALVAQHLAEGDLTRFREELAKHGIAYRREGSGSHFVDADGVSHNCYDVDPSLARGKIKLLGVKDHLPDEPDAIKLAIETRRNQLADIEVAPSNAEDEWKRFTRHHPQLDDESEKDAAKVAWWEEDIRRSFREEQRGSRTHKVGSCPWQHPHRAQGSLGSSTSHPGKVRFKDAAYSQVERPWQTEFWRGTKLVASVRHSRMAIYSKNDEDIRAALQAAHLAWGKVEVFGNAKFKKKMVKLAVEMDIPLSNPELQIPIEDLRHRRSSDARRLLDMPKITTASHSGQVGSSMARPQLVDNGVTGASSPPPRTQETQSLSPVIPVVAPKSAVIAISARNQRDQIVDAIRQIDEHKLQLDLQHGPDGKLFLQLEPTEAARLGLDEAVQRQHDMQIGLKPLFVRQREVHQRICDAVAARTAGLTVEKSPYRNDIVIKMQTTDENVLQQWHDYQRHTHLKSRLIKLHESLNTLAPAGEIVSTTSPVSMHHQAGKGLTTRPRAATSPNPAAKAGKAIDPGIARELADGPAAEVLSEKEPKETTSLSPNAGDPASDDVMLDEQPTQAPQHGGEAAIVIPAPETEADEQISDHQSASVAKEKAPTESDVHSPPNRGNLLETHNDQVVAAFDAANNSADVHADEKVDDRAAIVEDRSPVAPSLTDEETRETRDASQSLREDDPQQSIENKPISAMAAWDALGLNDLDALDEIGRDKKLLIRKGEEVVFAAPDRASDAHRLCLAAFRSSARRLYKEQRAQINDLSEVMTKGRAAFLRGEPIFTADQMKLLKAYQRDPTLAVIIIDLKRAKDVRVQTSHQAEMAAQKGWERIGK